MSFHEGLESSKYKYVNDMAVIVFLFKGFQCYSFRIFRTSCGRVWFRVTTMLICFSIVLVSHLEEKNRKIDKWTEIDMQYFCEMLFRLMKV